MVSALLLYPDPVLVEWRSFRGFSNETVRAGFAAVVGSRTRRRAVPRRPPVREPQMVLDFAPQMTDQSDRPIAQMAR